MGLVEKLQSFGLEGKKAEMYLAALELGTAKASEIAKKAKVERATIYDILNKLVRDGLVSFYEVRGVRYFRAEDPEKLLIRLQERERLFERILPELRSVYNTLTAKPRIRFYEGVEGIKTVLQDTLSVRDKKLRGILSVVDLFTVPGKEFMDTYVAERIKLKIGLRVIRSEQKEVPEYWPTDPRALRELRYAPKGMVFAMTTYVYDDKVALVSSQKENFGMIIESKEFSETFGHLFEALWRVSAPA